MARNLSPRKAIDALNRARARAASMRSQTERATEVFVQTAEASAAAFAVGVSHGKFGGVQIAGVPLELGLGVALSLGGVVGAAGKQSHHLTGIGTGLLAAYATTLGRGVGRKMAEAPRATSGMRMIGAAQQPDQITRAAPPTNEMIEYARARAKQAA